MMTKEEFELLCSEEMRRQIEKNIDRNPVDIALDKRIANAALTATQVKYLQRARRKLPSFFEARCIIPPLAFEQSSGEECARHKSPEGESVLDLTCGLGADSFALAGRFRRVVAVERNEVLAAVARENFRRLGAGNIEVVCDSAENYLKHTAEHFDWCFADPDRRGADGGKKVLLEDCSPNMRELLPDTVGRIADRICLKLSPMFDVDEVFRILNPFGRCSVETVSSGGECKEILAFVDDSREPSLTATALGRGSFTATADDRAGLALKQKPFEPESYRYLIVPDVALQKARLVRRCFGRTAYAAGENGFVFACERPAGDILGRVFEIERIERYEPKRLHRELKGRRAEIMLREVPLTLQAVMRAAGVREGAEVRLAVTSAEGEIWAIRLK